jgi:hypothetical protein
VFDIHRLGPGTIRTQLQPNEIDGLREFLSTIDGTSLPPPSSTDAFLDAIGG